MSLRFSSSVAANDRFGICFVCEECKKKKNDGELIGLETQSIVHVFINQSRSEKKQCSRHSLKWYNRSAHNRLSRITWRTPNTIATTKYNLISTSSILVLSISRIRFLFTRIYSIDVSLQLLHAPLQLCIGIRSSPGWRPIMRRSIPTAKAQPKAIPIRCHKSFCVSVWECVWEWSAYGKRFSASVQHEIGNTETHNENRCQTQIETCIAWDNRKRNVNGCVSDLRVYQCEGCQASHEGRTRREHCFSIKILLKPAAIELSRCGVDSIGWENTFDAFAGESDYLTSFDHWNRAECLCFAADARTSTHTCNGCRTRNEWRRKQRPKVYGLEQNKAICYTCYAVAHHKMNINTFRPSRPCVWNRFWKFVCVGFRISHSAVVG